jgi:CBS domain containing-hemolysin-like protein
MDPVPLISITIALIFSFFFSGIEIAYLASNKLQLEVISRQKTLTGFALHRIIQKPYLFIGTTLIGNTVALVFYGISMAQMLEPLLQSVIHPALNNEAVLVILQTLLSTLVVLILAEFLPKSIFLLNPNTLLASLALPFLLLYYLLSPMVWAVVGLSRFLIRHLFQSEFSEERPAYGLTDLKNYLKNMESLRHEDESIALDRKIFSKALQFKSVQVRDCMIPRTEIVAVDIHDGLPALQKAFIESGHSKIIIYRDTIDDVIGYCHSAGLFRKPRKIEDLLTPIISVPETSLASDLMIQLISQRKSLAIVVDEFGGTAGLVSMEDIIEEIFGEIEDEHDQDDRIEHRLNDTTWLLSARLEIDYLNETYGWELPRGDYETLGGLILSYTEDIPRTGEVIEVHPYRLTVQSMLDNRIDTVRLEIINSSRNYSDHE